MLKEEKQAVLQSEPVIKELHNNLVTACKQLHAHVPGNLIVHAVCVFFVVGHNNKAAGVLVSDTVRGNPHIRLDAALALAEAAGAVTEDAMHDAIELPGVSHVH